MRRRLEPSGWFIGTHGGWFADMTEVRGPFASAELAAGSYRELLRLSRKALDEAPTHLAKPGDFFCGESNSGGFRFGVLIGPYKSRRAAIVSANEELESGATFLNESPFVGVVRFARREGERGPQFLILERVW